MLQGSNKGLNGALLGDVYPMIMSMIMVQDLGVRMMKEYFEIKTSKATLQYRFRKRLNLSSNEGYQATKDDLQKDLLERGYIDMLSTHSVTWDIRKQALGYLMFFKRNKSRKMKGTGCANGCP